MTSLPLPAAVLGDLDLPKSTRDSAGLVVDLSTAVWRLNDITRHATINWSRFENCDALAVSSLKSYTLRLIERASPRHACNTANIIGDYLCSLEEPLAPSAEVDLISLMWYLQRLRKTKTAWKFHHIRAWYEFCADQAMPEFDDDTLFAIRDLRIPGNKKGVAVLSADPDEGPLDEFEEIALRRALIRDNGPIQERAALWLALAFGTNPANLALLWDEDFQQKDFDGLPTSYFLAVPRIKKRLPPRSEFKVRYIEEHLAAIIVELVDHNKTVTVPPAFAQPLFRHERPRHTALGTAMEPLAYHFQAGEITDLITRCVRRLNVVSPRTGRLLRVTTRRLRYTYASKMVRQGVSARDLADLLDHTDTQNVMVYFNADSRFVERLDKAIATQLGPIIRPFMGTVEEASTNGSTINLIAFRDLADIGHCGADYVCGLAVGRSCYTCVKFKARPDGPHNEVLEQLIAERGGLIASRNERMAEQLDETILAVGEVVAHIDVVSGSDETAA